MILSDSGDEVVHRRDTEVLTGCTKLLLQLDGSPLGSLADPQPWEFTRINGREVTTCVRLEQQRRAGGDQASRDPL